VLRGSAKCQKQTSLLLFEGRDLRSRVAPPSGPKIRALAEIGYELRARFDLIRQYGACRKQRIGIGPASLYCIVGNGQHAWKSLFYKSLLCQNSLPGVTGPVFNRGENACLQDEVFQA
jgi:hypothetical protein